MMPSTSKKQHNFMAAVANNPSFAKKVGVPQSVGKEFNIASDVTRKIANKAICGRYWTGEGGRCHNFSLHTS